MVKALVAGAMATVQPAAAAPPPLAGSTKQLVAGAVELGGEPRAAAMVRMKPRHQSAVRSLDLRLSDARRQAQNLQGGPVVHGSRGRLRRRCLLGLPIG